jgi:hypothetical protein
MAASIDSRKRVIMTLSTHPISENTPIGETGLPFLWPSYDTETPFLVVRTKDRQLLQVVKMTVEGGRSEDAVKAAIRAKLLREGVGGELVTFRGILI